MLVSKITDKSETETAINLPLKASGSTNPSSCSNTGDSISVWGTDAPLDAAPAKNSF